MINYAEGYTERYKNTFEYWVTTVRHRLIAESMAKLLPARILEVGPGPDPVFVHYNHPWEYYLIMDPIREYVLRAEEMAARNGLCVDALVTTVENHKDGMEPFNYIILSSLIHEVSNPREVLMAARSLCCSDGMIHVNVPNVNSLHMLLGVEMGILDSVFDMTTVAMEFGRPTRFDMDGLVGMVEGCGFRVVREGSYLLKPFSNEMMAALASEALVKGLEQVVRHFPDNGCELYVEAVPCS